MAGDDEDERERDGEAEPGADGDDEGREGRWGFTRLGEQLSGLLDPEAALRRGQGLVTGVTQATKDEAMRIVSAEVRNFLDGMDIADLAQQVISGLVVDVNMQVRFSREDDEKLAQPKITRNETTIRTRREADEPTDESESAEDTAAGKTGKKAGGKGKRARSRSRDSDGSESE